MKTKIILASLGLVFVWVIAVLCTAGIEYDEYGVGNSELAAATNTLYEQVLQDIGEQGGLVYYLIGSTTNAASSNDFSNMSQTPGSATIVNTQTFATVTNNQYLAEYITPTNEPALTLLKSGQYYVHFHARKTAVPGTVKIKAELYIYHNDAVVTQEIDDTAASAELGTTSTAYDLLIPVLYNYVIAEDDRLIIKLKTQSVSGTPMVEIQTEGPTYAFFTFPVSSGQYVLHGELESATNAVVDWVVTQSYVDQTITNGLGGGGTGIADGVLDMDTNLLQFVVSGITNYFWMTDTNAVFRIGGTDYYLP